MIFFEVFTVTLQALYREGLIGVFVFHHHAVAAAVVIVVVVVHAVHHLCGAAIVLRHIALHVRLINGSVRHHFDVGVALLQRRWIEGDGAQLRLRRRVVMLARRERLDGTVAECLWRLNRCRRV